MARCRLVNQNGKICNKIYSCKSCHEKIFHTSGFQWPHARRIDASSWPSIGQGSPISDAAWAQPISSYPIDPQILAADELGK